jgi:hypothetical protein
MEKCAVCNKETKTTVCCSSCGGISYAYCDECLQAGREPYDALVGMGLYYDDINKGYQEKILLPSLKFYKKTIDEFNADIKRLDDDYNAWCKEQAKEDNEGEM